MASLDTNILVRFLIDDGASTQQRLARLLVADAVGEGVHLHVPTTVLLELEWVLRSVYKVSKEEFELILGNLLAKPDLKIASEAAIEVALELYRNNATDFADCLHVALAYVAGESPLWTFDRRASQLPGANLLA